MIKLKMDNNNNKINKIIMKWKLKKNKNKIQKFGKDYLKNSILKMGNLEI